MATYVGQSNSASNSIAIPSGSPVAGHTFFAVCANGSGSAISTPSGWSLVRTVTVGTIVMAIFRLNYNGSGAPWTATGATSNVCTAWAGVDQTTNLSAETGGNGGYGSTVGASAITNGAGEVLIAAFANNFNFAYSAFSNSATQRGQVTSGARATMVDTNVAGPGGSQTITATIASAGFGNAAWVGSIKNAAAGPNTSQFFPFF